MQDPETSRLIGHTLGDYLLRGALGAGGMAEVYRALDQTLEREVAVKVLPAAFATDADSVRRFREEAKQVAALQHPHIVPIYAFGEERGSFYHVMPLLHGSLRDRLRTDGRLPPEEAVRLVRQVASALEAAHALGLVHRDVKPENILLDADGNALLTDFGIARELAALRQAGVARTLARTGMPVGTPEYMAPEQLRAVPCDQRADIYSLGVVLYELLTGAVPHTADSPFEVAALVLTTPILPPSQRNPQVWPALEQVVQQALASDPADRYPDMQGFAAALDLALHRTAARESATPQPPVAAVRASASAAAGAGAGGRGAGWRLPLLPLVLPLPLPLPAKLPPPRTLVALALVPVLVTAALGTGVLLLHVAGNGGPAAAGGGGSGDLSAAVHTASALAPVPPAATAVAQPTATPPVPRPSPTPVPRPFPTPSPTPAPTLRLQPTPLVLRPSPQNPTTCVATQTITNTTSQTVGWQWQPPQAGGFHFQVNGGPMVDWPKDLLPGIAPGGTDTLSATSPCQTQPKAFAILLTDTLGDQYTFVLQLQ